MATLLWHFQSRTELGYFIHELQIDLSRLKNAADENYKTRWEEYQNSSWWSKYLFGKPEKISIHECIQIETIKHRISNLEKLLKFRQFPCTYSEETMPV